MSNINIPTKVLTISYLADKMPTLEGLEEAGLEKIPDLSIAKMRFELTLDADSAKELKIDQSEVMNCRLYYYLYITNKTDDACTILCWFLS